MKKYIWLLLVVAIFATMMVSAFADVSPYLRYISSGKGVAGSATHTSNTRVYVTQTSNVHTETGETGPKIHYGARKTNTTSGSSICNAMSINGYSGATNATYKTEPGFGATIYLVVQPATATSSGQWEVSGTWSP